MDWIQKREGVVLFADGLERRFIIFFKFLRLVRYPATMIQCDWKDDKNGS